MLAWLIRYAESQANFGLATADPATIPLTERGWAQARHLAAGFVAPPSLIVTSAHTRTKQTAQPTRERFPGVVHEEWPLQAFTYLPSLQGWPTTAAQRRPLVEAYWRRPDPFYVESTSSARTRSPLPRCSPEPTRSSSGSRAAVMGRWQSLPMPIFIRAVLWVLLTRPERT